MGMVRFVWEETKARSNARKHGVRFEDAMLVFADPYALSEQDRLEGGELRWQTLGLAGGIVLLLVAHTVRSEQEDEIIRIISARRATRRERKRYDENRKEESLQ
jgi:uncharacterized DUF497 family protein